MKKLGCSIVIAFIATACSATSGSNLSEKQQFATNEQLAIQNVMCVFEPHPEGKQSPCAHMIENRLLLGRFFAFETLGGFKESEKAKGRRITTKFIVNAAASIKQCRKVPLENTINIIRDVKIADGTYLLKGTAPLSEENSFCFLTPDLEAS